MNLKIRDNLLIQGMHMLNRLGELHVRGLSEIDVCRSSGILVVVTTALGDAVFCTPLLRVLKTAFPDKKIGLMVHAAFQDLFLCDKNIDVIIPYHGKFRKAYSTWKRLRDESFDIALVANSNDPDVIPMLYWAGMRSIIRRPWKSTIYQYLVSNPEMMGKGQPPDHAIPMNMRMADMLGIRNDNIRTYLCIRDEANVRIEELFRSLGIKAEKPLICFHPGASLISKMWPLEKYSELGSRLAGYCPGVTLILTGSKKEEKICSSIAAGIGRDAFNLAGKLALSDLAAAIQKCDLFVSGDTGPFHIANALDVKTVTIYGPSDEKTNGPIWDLEFHRVIKKRFDCYYDNCARWCKDPECIDSISGDVVFDECKVLLDTRKG
jgi:ADP-heptose:LPS heptosyltransferase